MFSTWNVLVVTTPDVWTCSCQLKSLLFICSISILVVVLRVGNVNSNKYTSVQFLLVKSKLLPDLSKLLPDLSKLLPDLSRLLLDLSRLLPDLSRLLLDLSRLLPDLSRLLPDLFRLLLDLSRLLLDLSRLLLDLSRLLLDLSRLLLDFCRVSTADDFGGGNAGIEVFSCVENPMRLDCKS